ncbi:hypothetical protein ACVBGD_28900 [Klebsiella pneumoniae]
MATKTPVKDKGRLWITYGKKITEVKILDIKQTGIQYPDTPLIRYTLEDKVSDIVLPKNQSSIQIGKKYYFLNKEDADNKIK